MQELVRACAPFTARFAWRSTEKSTPSPWCPLFCLYATRGTNLCLVLTPLTFSVVLGSASALRACLNCSPGSDLQPTTAPPLPVSRAVVSFVINNVLLNTPDFKCGCLCTAYTTPDGAFTFSYSNVRPCRVLVFLPSLSLALTRPRRHAHADELHARECRQPDGVEEPVAG